MRPGGGLIYLNDLDEFSSRGHLRRCLLEHGVSWPPRGPSFRRARPPRRLVVFCASTTPTALAARSAWLQEASAIWLFRDHRNKVSANPAGEDAWWAKLCAQQPNLHHVDDLGPGDPVSLQVALDWARDAAPLAEEPTPHPLTQWPAGPWLPFDGAPPRFLASRIRMLREGPALATDTGARALSTSHPSPLVLSDSRTVMESVGSMLGEHRLEIPGWDHPGRAIGYDSFRPLAGAGHRTRFRWLAPTRQGVSMLNRSVHDWPVGHARKVWASNSNFAEALAVHPDGNAYVSTFSYDTMISSAVPIRWRATQGLALATPLDEDEDPLAALFFVHEPDRWDAPNMFDADARTRNTTVVLAEQGRYAVALAPQTWRLSGDEATRLDDGNVEYAVFDATHHRVRAGRGVLLGGWFEHATVLDRGVLWREALTTGERTRLSPADRPIRQAAPVPGTENVVLVSDGHLRLL